MIDHAYAAGVDVIVHLGDFGFWVPDPGTRKYLRRVEQRLAERGMWLFFVDGNHEDHSRLARLPIDAVTGLREVSAHVRHLPRGHRWTWHDENGAGTTWMALGGAVSVDRQWRTVGTSWWPTEVLSTADIDRAVTGGVVDVMVSHDAPARVTPPGLDAPSTWPADALADAQAHRGALLSVVNTVRPRHLWHGHYHVRYDDRLYLGPTDTRPGWDGVCVVHGLDCDRGAWENNLRLVHVDGTPRAWPAP